MTEINRNLTSPRIPPHNLDAEKSVLGAMLLSTNAVSRASEFLNKDDFYYRSNGIIYDAMLALSSKAQPIDFVTVVNKLNEMNQLDVVGGDSYIVSLSSFLPSAANLMEYVRIVEEKSVIRQLIEAAGRITESCFEADRELNDIVAAAEKEIFTISQRSHHRSFVSMKKAVMDALKRIQELSEGGAVMGLRTGYNNLDHQITGLHNSDLMLLASRPGMGKTSFGLNLAHNVVKLNEGAVVAIFNLEMPYEQLAMRLLSNASGLPLQAIRSGEFHDLDDFSRLTSASIPLAKTKIYIDDSPNMTVMEIRSKCRRLMIEHGLSLVIIDYLQLLSPSGGRRAESRQLEVSEYTRALKLLARELDVPVMLLAQLSRAPDRRENHTPMLADLRESGSIEQDADIVMFVYRESYYWRDGVPSDSVDKDDKPLNPNDTRLIIAKQRNGPTGTIHLRWDAETTSFHEFDEMGMLESHN